jgi:hypothetical protein
VGVYHIASTDGGATWTEPVKISQPFDSREISFARVKIIADNAGRLHAVWDTSNLEGFGQSIYYARSVDDGATWSPAVQMAYLNPGEFDVGWPYITAVGSDELHLTYNAVESVGRWERISRDGGAIWSQAKFILPEMEGINGYTIPLVDSNGQLHLIINMRPSATQKVGIYYSDWQGDGWSPAIPLANEGPMAETAHYVAAAILSGREIHVIWNQVRGGEIWHMQGTVRNAQPLSARPLPTMTPAPPPTPTPAVIVLESAPQQRLPVNQAVTASGNTASNSPLIPGTAAAIAFVGIVAIGMWWRRWRSRAG